MPAWLHTVAVISLLLGAAGALIVVVDIFVAGHRQKMWIMEIVWPMTALWGSFAGLYAYFRVGRLATKDDERQGRSASGSEKPFWQSVGVGATHCGAGCALADLVAEWFVFFVPITLFGHEVYGAWAVDYAVAFAFGIAFQYFTIKPKRGLTPVEGLRAALKADTLSLTSWQLGMYGWMALVLFVFFTPQTLHKTSPVFWFSMQIAMGCGFLTSYPVNWLLLRRGIKEAM